jgi:hypothetical protein
LVNLFATVSAIIPHSFFAAIASYSLYAENKQRNI